MCLQEVDDVVHAGAVILGLVSKLQLVTGEVLVDPVTWSYYFQNFVASQSYDSDIGEDFE